MASDLFNEVCIKNNYDRCYVCLYYVEISQNLAMSEQFADSFERELATEKCFFITCNIPSPLSLYSDISLKCDSIKCTFDKRLRQ